MDMPDFDVEAALVLGLGATFGALGGLSRYLVTKEEALRTIVTGLVAAFAAIFIARPVDWVGLVTGAAAAGYASDAVLAGFISQTKLSTAKAEAEQAKEEAKQASARHAEAEADLGKAIGGLKSAYEEGALESVNASGPSSAWAIAAELEASQSKRMANRSRA